MMATDPAVQAAQAYLHNVFCGTPSCDLDCLTDARSVVAAVTPLIRAQAFTEAADKLEAATRLPDCGDDVIDGLWMAAGLVRGLGEETENA